MYTSGANQLTVLPEAMAQAEILKSQPFPENYCGKSLSD
jgi:hypothetical protein